MKIPVQVFTTPNCVQCNATTRLMDKLGITYDKVDLSQHPEALERFKELGHVSAPIVVTDRKTWSGFRIEKIKSLALANQEEAK